ncbi:MAG: DEAD/DEAH box helicase family protein, partial [Syntrophomonadaceae bacterium]|nr:DEAD/DEAH box helicase family protein [Syntrophomonadaceae bacterium]
TGAGKTLLALAAIAWLAEQFLSESGRGIKIKIIVPQVFLAQQWLKSMQEELRIPREDLGIYAGGRKDPISRRVMIYVVNSARYSLSQHFMEDYRKGYVQFVIADECHHYTSPENFKVFRYINKINKADRGALYFSLGLTATPDTEILQEKLEAALGPSIYHYGFIEALNSQIINHFSIFNIDLPFNREEEAAYQEISERIAFVWDELLRLCPSLRGMSRARFFAVLESMAQAANGLRESELARSLLTSSHQRKDIVYRAESRLACMTSLVQQIPQQSRILVFCERIDLADKIFAEVDQLFPGQVGRYHSEMDMGSRKRMLERYRNLETRILISCRALDEGLDVPETDVGIVAASTSSPRQRVQRLGRILRRSQECPTSYLYYLYIGRSNEEAEMLGEATADLVGTIPVLYLQYNREQQLLSHPAYEELAQRVLRYARRQNWPLKIVSEIERNLEQGKIRCDWWMAEENCRERIRDAASRREKNYWITMRLMVLASLNRLK